MNIEGIGCPGIRWPDFFIVGAMRSGTTSLYEYLRSHPQIFMPSPKEPRFFNALQHARIGARRRGITPKVVRNITDYIDLFNGVKQHQIMGEASPTYLSDETAAMRIKNAVPEAKIIAILREPIERAYSHFLLEVREQKVQTSFLEALREDAEMTKTNGVSTYIWPGLYYRHVMRFLRAFDPEHLRIYLYDDFASDTRALVKDVVCFLDVPFDDGRFFEPATRHNAYAASRGFLADRVLRSSSIQAVAKFLAPRRTVSALRDRFVLDETPKPPLDPEARAFLRPIFQDEIMSLQDLIGRDLSHWLEDSGPC